VVGISRVEDCFGDFTLNHHLNYLGYVEVGNMCDTDDNASSLVDMRGKMCGN